MTDRREPPPTYLLWILFGPGLLLAAVALWTAAIITWTGQLAQQLAAGGTLAFIVGFAVVLARAAL